MTGTPWLEIDIQGFAQILHNKGISRIALEPISNAFDTAATGIVVDFTQTGGWAELVVTDDDPDGFTDLKDAYTLYAPSTRRDDPSKRGRFGQGEKELVAVCSTGGNITVASTTGTVFFEKEGRRRTRTKTKVGSQLHARFRCTSPQAAEFRMMVLSLLVPKDVKLVFNGDVMAWREPLKTARESLPTVIADGEGNLRSTTRVTNIDLLEPEPYEVPHIFELGVPVVEHDGRFHVNVGQKVPLNAARDNVTPAYLRKLREIVLAETHDVLTPEDMKSGWVYDALATASPEALRSHIDAVHGAGAVIFDPSNPEASKRAMEDGRTVVYGRQYSSDTWKNLRDNQILQPAGKVMDTGIKISPDGKPPIEEALWTGGMVNVARYTQEVGEYLLGFKPEVRFQNLTVTTVAGHAIAWWGDQTITFNLRFLGKSWPEAVGAEELDELLIHEFTHHTDDDHWSDSFIRTCCRLGAKLRSCPVTL